jgi:hypothetical protein
LPRKKIKKKIPVEVLAIEIIILYLVKNRTMINEFLDDDYDDRTREMEATGVLNVTLTHRNAMEMQAAWNDCIAWCSNIGVFPSAINTLEEEDFSTTFDMNVLIKFDCGEAWIDDEGNIDMTEVRAHLRLNLVNRYGHINPECGWATNELDEISL